ncbi:MAG: type II toxin-antitoxin system HicB family antitoxin [Desulfonatronovibrio sp.]
MQQLNIKVEVFREDDLYVAVCPSLIVSSFGEIINEAKKSLVEALKIFIDECSEMGTIQEVLEESGFTKKDHEWLPGSAGLVCKSNRKKESLSLGRSS